MSDDPIEVVHDGEFSTTLTIFCECGEMVDGTEVVLRECPHQNGTRIEHCPKCDAELGVMTGPTRGPFKTPDCECWS